MFYLMVISYVFTASRILWSKIGPKRPESNTTTTGNAWKLPSIRHLIEENSLANMTTVATAVAFHISYIVGYFEINSKINPGAINDDSNYIWLHFLNHIPPLLWNVFALMMIFNQSSKLRESFLNQSAIFLRLIWNNLKC
jgi:hypothetical protein